MKKIIFNAIFIATMLGSAGVGFAADFASIDFRYVVAESAEMKRALAEVETMKKAMEKELAALEKDLEQASESLRRKRSVLSQEQVLEEETALKAKLREYRIKGESMNEQLGNEVALRRKRVITGLEKVVNKLATEAGYRVVFDSSTLLYAAEGVDITEKTLTALNAHFEQN